MVQQEVIVIGAGFSGLACAYELVAAGHKVKILEARDRVGGRVHSQSEFILGKNVEFGGELIGSNHPHWLSYASKFNLELIDVSDDSRPSPAIINNQKLDHEQFQSLRNEVQIAFECMSDAAKDVDVEEPWNTPNAIQLDNTPTSEWIAQLNISDLAKHLFDVQLSSDNAVPTDKQSLLGNLVLCKAGGFQKFWDDSESYRCKGGNQKLAFCFSEVIGSDNILFNCPVTSITTEPAVIVTDIHGNQHTADYVVLTIPPSLWSNIKFSPELMVMPQMGLNTKHLSVVRGSFWGDLSPNAWGDKHINQTWSGTDGQNESDYSALVSFSGGNSAKAIHESAGSELLRELEDFYPDISKHVIKTQLIDWIGDPWTRGGYSFPAPGEVTTIGPILQNGIGRLQFAGEYACYQFAGYMEGALCSGASLAKRISGFMFDGCCCTEPTRI